MLRVLPLFAVFAAVLPAADTAFAHCQVPCGIYGDQRVFEELLEHHATITKATLQIGELTGKMSGGPDAQDVNQLTRWVSNKESHAQLVQERMLNYFLAQRIKADKPNYVEQLKTAHAVIVAAMKCKQSGVPGAHDALEAAILDFYRAYEGKEPVFE